MQYTRRKALAGLGGIVGTSLAGCLDGGDSGGSYPEEDISLIIPYGPGGGYDFYGRLLARHLSEELSVDVQAENVEGSGGIVATEQVYDAEPDGYTIEIMDGSGFALAQVLEDVDFDLQEMTYFGTVAQDVKALAVGTNTDIESFDDYVSAVQNEEILFATQGALTDGILVPTMIGHLSGLYDPQKVIDNVVTYDGTGEGVQGIARGDAHVQAGPYSSLLPYVESDDLQMLLVLVTDDSPPESTPDAATLESAGVDSAQEIRDSLTSPRVVGGPPDVEQDRVDALADAMETVLTSDELVSEAEDSDRPINYAGAEETSDAMTTMIEAWSGSEDLLEQLQG